MAIPEHSHKRQKKRKWQGNKGGIEDSETWGGGQKQWSDTHPQSGENKWLFLFLLSRASSVPSLNGRMSGSGMMFKQGFSELLLRAPGVGVVCTQADRFFGLFLVCCIVTNRDLSVSKIPSSQPFVSKLPSVHRFIFGTVPCFSYFCHRYQHRSVGYLDTIMMCLCFSYLWPLFWVIFVLSPVSRYRYYSWCSILVLCLVLRNRYYSWCSILVCTLLQPLFWFIYILSLVSRYSYHSWCSILVLYLVSDIYGRSFLL
jgi:hypothetical protein